MSLRNGESLGPTILQTFYTSPITFHGGVRSISVRELGGGILGLVAANIPPYRDEHLVIDYNHQSAILDNERMPLTRKEYDLLSLLVRHAGEIIPREALLMQVWGYGAEIRTRTLDVHVRRLRKKLGGYADHYIETIFGIGYRFQPYHAPRYVQPVAVGA
jgi:two-component system phosphate regulon response regulator PhoB